MTYTGAERTITIKVRWTDAKGEPVTKRVSYTRLWSEAEVVAHVVREHDRYHSPDDIGVEEVYYPSTAAPSWRLSETSYETP